MDNNLNTQSPRNVFTGINQDTWQNKNPTFVLNGVIESVDGEQGVLSTEDANSWCFSLPVSHKIIGSISMENNEIAIFTTDNTISKIFIFGDDVFRSFILLSICALSSKKEAWNSYKLLIICFSSADFSNRIYVNSFHNLHTSCFSHC